MLKVSRGAKRLKHGESMVINVDPFAKGVALCRAQTIIFKAAPVPSSHRLQSLAIPKKLFKKKPASLNKLDSPGRSHAPLHSFPPRISLFFSPRLGPAEMALHTKQLQYQSKPDTNLLSVHQVKPPEPGNGVYPHTWRQIIGTRHESRPKAEPSHAVQAGGLIYVHAPFLHAQTMPCKRTPGAH